MSILPITIGAIAALGVLLVAWAIATRPDRTQVRLARLASPEVQTLEQLELQRPLLERTLKPLAMRLSGTAHRLSSSSFDERTAKRLAIAGDPANLTTGEYVALKIVVAVLSGGAVTGLFALLSAPILTTVVMGVAAFGVGYVAPEFWLRRKVISRQQRILQMIPDALDLLTISVRAGLGFDAGLERVVNKLDGPLSDEFRRALAEVRIGKPRRDALHDVVARTEVRPLASFISAIIQAERLGVPIASVLQVQSEQLRIERRQRAEEAAGKAPIQMLFPLVGCVFPALFIVILGPAIVLLASHAS
jgi:tight adherence protein C